MYNGIQSVCILGVLALTFCFVFSKCSQAKDDLGTYNEPEAAFNAVSESLEMVSKHLNTGTATFKVLHTFEHGKEALGYLNTIEAATTVIFKHYTVQNYQKQNSQGY